MFLGLVWGLKWFSLWICYSVLSYSIFSSHVRCADADSIPSEETARTARDANHSSVRNRRVAYAMENTWDWMKRRVNPCRVIKIFDVGRTKSVENTVSVSAYRELPVRLARSYVSLSLSRLLFSALFKTPSLYCSHFVYTYYVNKDYHVWRDNISHSVDSSIVVLSSRFTFISFLANRDWRSTTAHRRRRITIYCQVFLMINLLSRHLLT